MEDYSPSLHCGMLEYAEGLMKGMAYGLKCDEARVEQNVQQSELETEGQPHERGASCGDISKREE